MVAEKAAAAGSVSDSEGEDIFDIFVMGILNKDELPSYALESDDEGPDPPVIAPSHDASVNGAEAAADQLGLKQIQPEIPARVERP